MARVVPSLISAGRYDHPWMGISMFPVDALLAERLGLPVSRGVLITDVREGSPAADAGLEPGDREEKVNGIPLRVGGDVVIALDGEPVADGDQLIGLLDLNHVVGDTIVLSVLREGAESAEDVQLTLAARP